MNRITRNRHSILIGAGLGLVLFFSAPGFVGASGGGSAIGFIEGNFSTNSRGAGLFQIPIKVAPGTQNLHPELNLVFNSQNNKNGMLGVGWAISGLSAIDRCGKVRHLDGRSGSVDYSNRDRLCRDGQRMVPRNSYSNDAGYWNNTYRLEIEDQSETVASGRCGSGPCTFTVHMPRNHQLVYGGTADSRVTHRNGTVRTWHLSQIRDRNGNTIDFQYTRPSGTALVLPKRISYGNREVRFFYENRPDFREIVRIGDTGQGTHHKFELRHRMIRIESSTADGVFKRYKFAYEKGNNSRRSLLNRIEECDASNNCLEPTTVAWHNRVRSDYFNRVEPSGAEYQAELRGEGGAKIIPGDFNGDGKTDFLRMEHAGWAIDDAGSFQVYFSKGDGKFRVVEPSGFDYQAMLREHVGTRLLTGDFDGDGRTDFIAKKPYLLFFPEDFIKVYYSKGDGSFQIETLRTGDSNKFELATGDFNGDGISDLIMQSNDPNIRPAMRVFYGSRSRRMASSTQDHTHARYARHDGAVLIPGDFNGDGNTDLYRQEKESVNSEGRQKSFVYLSDGKRSFSPYGVAAPKYRLDDGWHITPADINGDGKTDLMLQGNGSLVNDGGTYFRVLISKGDGTFDNVRINGADHQWRLGRSPGARIIPLDYNGDGKTDFIRQEHGGWDDHGDDSFKIYISRGNGAFDILHPRGDNYIGQMPGDMTWLTPGDFNGDGKMDFIRQEHGA